MTRRSMTIILLAGAVLTAVTLIIFAVADNVHEKFVVMDDAMSAIDKAAPDTTATRIRALSRKTLKQIEELKDSQQFSKTSIKALDTLDLCRSVQLEFVDVYPEEQKIQDDDKEILKVVARLKGMNFVVTSGGRGNWVSGPRIVSIEMTNNMCRCRIDKLYYSDNGSGDLYRTTERIVCYGRDR